MKNQIDVGIAAMFFTLGVAVTIIPAALFYFSFDRVVFERPLVVAPPADDSDYECIRAEVLSANFNLIRNDDGAVDDLKSGKILSCDAGHEVEIKGFNISKDVVYALANDKFFRDPDNNHHGYRIYIGEMELSGGATQLLSLIYPLNEGGEVINPIGNRYSVIKANRDLDGPCPDMCD